MILCWAASALSFSDFPAAAHHSKHNHRLQKASFWKGQTTVRWLQCNDADSAVAEGSVPEQSPEVEVLQPDRFTSQQMARNFLQPPRKITVIRSPSCQLWVQTVVIKQKYHPPVTYQSTCSSADTVALMPGTDLTEDMCMFLCRGLSDVPWAEGYILVLYSGSGSKKPPTATFRLPTMEL